MNWLRKKLHKWNRCRYNDGFMGDGVWHEHCIVCGKIAPPERLESIRECMQIDQRHLDRMRAQGRRSRIDHGQNY